MHRRVILLVEDNLDDEKLTLRAMKKNNIVNDIIIARDGAEALEYIFAKGKYEGRDILDRPQVILLDLNLPKLDGRAVLKEIKESPGLRRIPVVILTTSSQEEDILRSYDLGVNSYITKPLRMEGFIEVVRDLERYWFELVVLPG